MRIALDIVPAQHSIDSGYGRYMYQLVPAIVAADASREYLAILGENGNEELLPRAPNLTIAKCHSRNQNINQQWYAARAAQRWGADLLHNMGAPATMLWRKKLILTIHDIAIVRHPEWFPARWSTLQNFLYGRLMKKHPYIVTVSEYSKSELIEYFHYPAERIKVVYPIHGFPASAITAEDISRVRARYNLPENYFLYAGVIEPRKNLVRLVQAFDEYCGTPKDGVSLVIAGKTGWHAAELKGAIDRSPFRNRITLPGYIAERDLYPMMAGARAFVYPSLYEGFGYPPLEAILAGTPVLSSNCSSLPESVGNAGLLVNPTDTHAIAQGLHRIDTDEALRVTLKANGMNHHLKFSAENTVRRVLHLYDELEYIGFESKGS